MKKPVSKKKSESTVPEAVLVPAGWTWSLEEDTHTESLIEKYLNTHLRESHQPTSKSFWTISTSMGVIAIGVLALMVGLLFTVMSNLEGRLKTQERRLAPNREIAKALEQRQHTEQQNLDGQSVTILPATPGVVTPLPDSSQTSKVFRLSFAEKCWVSINRDDKPPIFEANVLAGKTLKFTLPADQLFTVRDGCPGKIGFVLDGKPYAPDNASDHKDKVELFSVSN
jgi:hypothetical protein